MEPDQLAFFRVETASSFFLFGLGRSHIAAVALLCEQRIQHTSQHLDPVVLAATVKKGQEPIRRTIPHTTKTLSTSPPSCEVLKAMYLQPQT